MTSPDRRRGLYGSGHELPLPSDMDSRREVVDNLQVLWMVIRHDKVEDKKIQGRVVNRFFDELEKKRGKEEVEWLQGDDPHWGTPRAILIKERALQRCQLGEHRGFLKQERIIPMVEIFRGWISEVTGS